MRRTLLCILLCCGAAAHAAAGEALDGIRDRALLRVGTTGDYRPFSVRAADGSYHGADIVMAQKFGQAIGVGVAFVRTEWATLRDDFAAKKFDIAVGGVSILADRAKAGTFSHVTYVDGKRPIARCADQDRFSSIEAIDQPGIRVVTNPGASNEAFARAHFPRAALAVHTDNATVFEEIVSRRADVMVTDGIEVDAQAMLHPELCAVRVAAPFTRVEKAYLLPNDPDLLRIVNEMIDEDTATGEWTRTLEAAEQER